jgi:hypothetical protein
MNRLAGEIAMHVVGPLKRVDFFNFVAERVVKFVFITKK